MKLPLATIWALAVLLRGLTPAELAPCGGPPRAELAGELRLSLWVGRGVDPELAKEEARRASSYWATWGMALHFGDVGRIDAERAVQRPPSEGEEGMRRALAPLRAALAQIPDDGTVPVLLLPRVGAEDAPVPRDLRGLALGGGQVLDGEDDGAAQRLVELLGPPERPVVLLSEQGLRGLRTDEADAVLAHEIGHLLGLGHRGEAGNLMTPGALRCLPGLDARQLAVLRGIRPSELDGPGEPQQPLP